MSPALVIYLVWALWFIAWFAAAVLGKREPGTLRGPLSFVFHLAAILALTLLLAIVRPFPATDLQNKLWPFGVPDGVGWVLILVALAGFGLYAWASVHRINALRHGARVVDSGPYTVVRHPVYLGAMIGALATAILFGQPTSLLGALLLILAMVGKVLLEERTADDAAHSDYRKRVPMFVPFLRLP